MAKFAEIFDFQSKSGIKAGDGLEAGKYFFYTSSNEQSKFLNEYLFDGDALVFGTGGNPSVHFNDSKFAVSTDCLVAQPKDKRKVYAKFYYYFLRGNMRILEKGFKGAGLKHISKGYISAIELPKVDFDQQKKIVEILDHADVLRQKRKQSLQLLDDFLRAMFLDMFGDPVENQKKLNVVTLGDLCEEIKYGTNVKGSNTPSPGSIPVIRIPNVLNGRINFDDLKYVVVDKKEKERLLLRQEDLLFVRSNGNPDYIGRCAVFEADKECINASYLIRARLKKDSPIIAGFIRDVISFPSYRSKVQKEARTTAGNYNINTQGLRGLKILKPNIKEQQRFEEISRRISMMRLKMNTSLGELDNQFNALTQRYFE